jgi:hypothetical protein
MREGAMSRNEQDIIKIQRQVGEIVMAQFRAMPEWYREILSRPSYEQLLAARRNEEMRRAREGAKRIVAQIHGDS